MLQVDWLTPIVMGGVFFVLGVILFTWGKRAENSYYDSLANSVDVRKFVEQSPRPKFVSLKIGGRVSLAVGFVLIIIGCALWLWA